MSEADALDSFFAKKDKKKKKGKFTTTEEIAKKLTSVEGGEMKKEKTPSKKPDARDTFSEQRNTENRPSSSKTPTNNDEEWKDFEDPNEKDYSGLRVQSLQIASEKEDDPSEKEEDELRTEEGGEPRQREASGPWGRVEGSAEVKDQPPPPAEPARNEPKQLPQEPQGATKQGVYVPPSKRIQQRSSPSTGPSHRSRGNQRLDISSQAQFPSLADAATQEKQEKERASERAINKTFTEVRKGSRPAEPSNLGIQLELDNRYEALSKH